MIGAPLFGWANPVPVDLRNFKKPLRHMAFVAAAGPLSNILLAILSAGVLSLLVRQGLSSGSTAAGMNSAAIEMLVMAVQLNLFLAFFNLLPIPPLDGSRIVQGFVSPSTAAKIDGFASSAQWILLILVFTGALRILAVPVYGFMRLLFQAFGIPAA
jgi:Zn-dependent protease